MKNSAHRKSVVSFIVSHLVCFRRILFLYKVLLLLGTLALLFACQQQKDQHVPGKQENFVLQEIPLLENVTTKKYFFQQVRDPFQIDKNHLQNSSLASLSLQGLHFVGVIQNTHGDIWALLCASTEQYFKAKVGDKLQQGTAQIFKIEAKRLIIKENLNGQQRWITLLLAN